MTKGATPGVIRIQGMRFWGKHGANPHEREHAQPIDMDVELKLDFGPAIATDDLAHALDYDMIFHACEQVVTQRSFVLLESLAAACLDAVLADPRVQQATVHVRKPRLLDGATPEVELTRAR